jgi:NADH-quinone oxidoreductase subunit N
MSERPVDLLPELLLLAGAVAALIVGLFAPRARQGLAGWAAAAATVAALGASIWQWTGPIRRAFDDSYRVDTVTSAIRVTVCVTVLFVLVLCRDRFRGDSRETETYVLVLLGALGAIALSGANDLLLLMGAYTLASVPLYTLVGFAKDAAGTEAAMKYYLLGALFGLTMLLGITTLFGLAGQTAYPEIGAPLRHAPVGAAAIGVVALLAGLAFKASAVPAHFWIPDVAEGASPAVAAFVTTVPKLGALAATFRLFDGPLQHLPVRWRLLLAIAATASMTLGNLAAFAQTSPRRLLGYSTISQVGYLLLPVVVAGESRFARDALLFYLAGYALTNVGAFAVIAAVPDARTLDQYRGLARLCPAVAVALVICLLGFVGTPPLAIFIGKLTAFAVAIDGGWTWLAVVAAVNTVASVFYYLRWIVPLFATAEPGGALATRAWPRQAAYAAAASSLALGLLAGIALTSGQRFG